MTRPHYVLRLEVVDPPASFDGMDDVEPRLEVGKDSFPMQDGAFRVEYDLRFAGDLGWLPHGPAVRTEKDGRRFVYVAWHGTKDGARTRFRRLKVPLAGIDHFADEPVLRVAGRDAKGAPACAWATVLA